MLSSWHSRATEIVQQVSATDSRRVVIFHPALFGTRVILTHLIPRSHYVRFQGRALSLESVREQVAQMLMSQGSDADASRSALVLDEADRVEAEVLRDYLLELLGSDQFSHVFVFTRDLPAFLQHPEWREAPVHVVHPDGRNSDSDALTRPSAQLDVSAFGLGQVYVHGRRIERWEGQLTRRLFFLLIDHADGIGREQIFERFWATTSIRKATNIFHVTKTKLKENLFRDLDRKPELVQPVKGNYRLAADILLHYDVALFEAMLSASEGHTDDSREARQLLLVALDLARRDYLLDIRERWADERRTQLRRMKASALARLGRNYREADEIPTALAYLLRACVHDPTREDIARDALELCVQLNRAEDAEKVLSLITRELGRQFQISPSRDLRKLVESITSSS